MNDDTEFLRVYCAAESAGYCAATKAVPTPMGVTDGRQTWVVDDGPCGFAWVEIAGNTAFGRWAKKNGYASRGYPTGLHIWISEFGQSMHRKEVMAREMARVLNERGIKAYAHSRMD